MITSKNNIHRRLFYDMKRVTDEAKVAGWDIITIHLTGHDRCCLSDKDFKKFKKYWRKKGWIFKYEDKDSYYSKFVLRKQEEYPSQIQADWNYTFKKIN